MVWIVRGRAWECKRKAGGSNHAQSGGSRTTRRSRAATGAGFRLGALNCYRFGQGSNLLQEATPMIYTHVLNKGPMGVVSPVDTL